METLSDPVLPPATTEMSPPVPEDEPASKLMLLAEVSEEKPLCILMDPVIPSTELPVPIKMEPDVEEDDSPVSISMLPDPVSPWPVAKLMLPLFATELPPL
jgi:hypothetical protein